MEDTENQVNTTEEKKKEDQEREKERARRIKQQIMVPFIWEERPGAPKKDWKPKREALAPAPLPKKYVASVPFKWEEKPGTPLQDFTRESTNPEVPETVPENKSLPLPPAFYARCENFSDEESSYVDEYDEPDWLSELDLEALSVHTEESYSSALSPANRQMPREAVSSTVALKNPFIVQEDELIETPNSPERGAISPSRGMSLRGASFLQYLFPLYPPKSGFLDKAGKSEENAPRAERGPSIVEEQKKLGGDGKRSGVIRRPLTLGELIMESRRRSYRRKAVHMKKQNPPKDFTQHKTQGCFNFGASGGGIANMLGKDLLTLKLA